MCDLLDIDNSFQRDVKAWTVNCNKLEGIDGKYLMDSYQENV